MGLIFVVLMSLWTTIAVAHDAQHANMSGAWVGERGFFDPISTQSCCGNNDCKPLPDDGLREHAGGVVVVSTGEWIQHSRLIRTPTPDGGCWRCEFTADVSNVRGLFRKGTTRCLICPPPGF